MRPSSAQPDQINSFLVPRWYHPKMASPHNILITNREIIKKRWIINIFFIKRSFGPLNCRPCAWFFVVIFFYNLMNITLDFYCCAGWCHAHITREWNTWLQIWNNGKETSKTAWASLCHKMVFETIRSRFVLCEKLVILISTARKFWFECFRTGQIQMISF